MGTPVTLVDPDGVYVDAAGGGTGADAGQMQGNVASDDVDSGNPVKIGGVYNATLPVNEAGDRADVQSDINGNLRARLVAGVGGATDAILNSSVGFAGFANISGGSAPLGAAGYKFNGTTWDRDRKANASFILPSSLATTNPNVVKATPGDLHNVIVNNTSGSIIYLKFFNKTTAPSLGVDTPVLTFALKPLDITHLPLAGHYFSLGIGLATTAGAANLDAASIGAGDLVGLTVTYA